MTTYNDSMVSRVTPALSMKALKIHDAEQLQRVVNALLREAMTNERSKRWHKVIHNYRQLARMISRKNLPPDVSEPASYSMLMYEIFYHLGIALQQIGEHKRAVTQYTKAIEALFVPKNGCEAGCNSNSCLMTPLYARRAFAYAKAGDKKSALRDAEKAVVLDSRNPDVYCIRAMVRSTRQEMTLALQDAKVALRHNPNHLCALILKGRLVEPLVYDEWLDLGKKNENADHDLACSINPDCHNFLTVQDFNHSNILVFYERFLYSLSVPHTISEIMLTSRKSNGSQSRISSAKSTDSRGWVSRVPLEQHSVATRPFRCGTPAGQTKAPESLQRRKVYGDAVREYVSRPKTAEECVAYLEKQRQRRQLIERREGEIRKSPSLDNVHHRSPGGKILRTTATELHPQETHGHVKKPSVFQEMNLKDAPRMYYRPWLGDKLPVAEVDRKQWDSPPFKV